jgi:hypothetical protein
MNQVRLHRVPDCIYTAEGITELKQSEGLDDAQKKKIVDIGHPTRSNGNQSKNGTLGSDPF